MNDEIFHMVVMHTLHQSAAPVVASSLAGNAAPVVRTIAPFALTLSWETVECMMGMLVLSTRGQHDVGPSVRINNATRIVCTRCDPSRLLCGPCMKFRANVNRRSIC